MSAGSVHVAASEVRRLAPDALRMAGLSLSLADDAAPMLTWCVAAGLNVLDVLRSEVDRPARPAPTVLGAGDGTIDVDLADSSLLVHGARLVDVACASAAEADGPVIVRARRTWGGEACLPYIVRASVARGFAAAQVPDDGEWAVVLRLRPRRPGEREEVVPDRVLDDRVAEAVHHGIALAADDLQLLRDLAARIRVPTSDRSRSQAG